MKGITLVNFCDADERKRRSVVPESPIAIALCVIVLGTISTGAEVAVAARVTAVLCSLLKNLVGGIGKGTKEVLK